jgi:hypothetical protein
MQVCRGIFGILVTFAACGCAGPGATYEHLEPQDPELFLPATQPATQPTTQPSDSALLDRWYDPSYEPAYDYERYEYQSQVLDETRYPVPYPYAYPYDHYYHYHYHDVWWPGPCWYGSHVILVPDDPHPDPDRHRMGRPDHLDFDRGRRYANDGSAGGRYHDARQAQTARRKDTAPQATAAQRADRSKAFAPGKSKTVDRGARYAQPSRAAAAPKPSKPSVSSKGASSGNRSATVSKPARGKSPASGGKSGKGGRAGGGGGGKSSRGGGGRR